MKRNLVGLLAGLILLPSITFAQLDSWNMLLKKQRDEQKALFEKQTKEREDFLKGHPEVVSTMENERKQAQREVTERQARLQQRIKK